MVTVTGTLAGRQVTARHEGAAGVAGDPVLLGAAVSWIKVNADRMVQMHPYPPVQPGLVDPVAFAAVMHEVLDQRSMRVDGLPDPAIDSDVDAATVAF